MGTTAAKPAPLQNPFLPCLRDAADPKGAQHNLATNPLRAGDQLVVLHKCLGFPKKARLAIAGFGEFRDPSGELVAVTAYVLPMAYTADVVAYTERDFHRYPCAMQSEEWFAGARPVVLVQVDLTEYADCLRLERAAPVVAEQLGAYSQAAAELGWLSAPDGTTLSLAA